MTEDPQVAAAVRQLREQGAIPDGVDMHVAPMAEKVQPVVNVDAVGWTEPDPETGEMTTTQIPAHMAELKLLANIRDLLQTLVQSSTELQARFGMNGKRGRR